MDHNKIKKSLRRKFLTEIRCRLTVYMEDNGEEAFTDEKIKKYVEENNAEIDALVDRMFNDYAQDDEINELINPESDWIREYLYSEEFGLEFPECPE